MPNQKDSSGERDIRANDASNDRDYGGGGPDKIDVTSDNQPDLIAPSLHGADSGRLAPPREIRSNRNGPSDPDRAGGGKPS